MTLRVASCCHCLSAVRSLHVRSRYVPPPAEKLNYFPGHMHSGLFQIGAKLRSVDAVIEVHDARVPLSGRNPRFSRSVLTSRCHILVLNKSDLVPQQYRRSIIRHLASQGERHVVFTNCLDQRDTGVRSLVSTVVALLSQQNQQQQTQFGRQAGRYAHQMGEYQCMVLGVPNVGKSSLINALRALHLCRSRATPVGAVAGVTRSVMNRILVSQRPQVYVLDTPGVLVPRLSDAEHMLRLALCAALQDHLVGPEHLADYLLYWMNRRAITDYVSHLGIDEPLDQIDSLLRQSAISLGLKIGRRDLTRGGVVVHYPDVHRAAINMIRLFRTGAFGKLLLDDEILTQTCCDDGGL